MKVVVESNESILPILRRFLRISDRVRWSQYCVCTQVDAGVLVVNLLTRGMVLLSQEEYDNFSDNDYLKKNWFVVPDGAKEKEYADFLKWVLSSRQPKNPDITDYTIFTTTDCNARCFYCFELGRSRIPMSCKTAEKVVQYIAEHRGTKTVKISWFGGEPLFNQPAIETICKGLQQRGIPFKSFMVSNGYLFDDLTVQKAVEDWNLGTVQITLDGTEAIYNKIKAYIYREGNPYEKVMGNIGKLLDAGVLVSVRLNMDLYNADDLLVLAQELAQRFSAKSGLQVYAHHLFKGSEPLAQLHTEEEWQKRDEAMRRLTTCLSEKGLVSRKGISKKIKINQCMADSGSAVTILPEGQIGLCEHYTETDFIGHIDHEGADAAAVASWKEKTPEIPECEKCFYFLDCVKLKRCPNEGLCYKQHRQEKHREIKTKMINEYQKWLNHTAAGEDEDDSDC